MYLERGGDDGAPGGSAPDSSNWEEVARLLSRKHGRIDSLHALSLLPGQVGPLLGCSGAGVLWSLPGAGMHALAGTSRRGVEHRALGSRC